MDASQIRGVGRREERGCDTEAERWFAKVGVVIYPRRFLFAIGIFHDFFSDGGEQKL